MTDQHRKNQQGAALVLSLLVVVCLSGVGLGLAAASSAERQIAANARGAVATSAAAEAAVEGVLTEISAAPDWSVWLAGVTSRFHDATRRPLTPSRVTVDLDQVTTELQAEAATAWPLGPNTPAWRLVAWGTLEALAGLEAGASGAYVAVWAADDPGEADAQASADSNGTIMLHGEAFGFGATRRAVDVVIVRAAAGPRVLSWRSR